MRKSKVKFTIIGAGSASFSAATITDILLNKSFGELDIEIALMDIEEEPLRLSEGYCNKCAEALGKQPVITATLDLRKSLEDADFVITCFEKDRYYYWSQDFHIPRRYGFRQVYGENGGPGGMFHALRNLKAMMVIVKAMEELCPSALILNYTNPEAKLVDAVSKLSKIKIVGLCHGEMGGKWQLAQFLQMEDEWDDLETEACGLNHFGWFTKVARKSTGEDLYPLLREKEKKIDLLAHWDEYGLSRIMFRTYGLWPHPGTNHIGEYVAWSDEFLASAKIQYFYDPAEHNPWKSKRIPEFIYSFSSNPTDRELYPEDKKYYAGDPAYTAIFEVDEDNLKPSDEYGIKIAEAIFFDKPTEIGAVNVPNAGYMPNIPDGMAVELPALVDGAGIHPKKMPALPVAISAMISHQGAIHDLLIQAYAEKSKNKLLQAVLLDPTISNYNNAVAMINEMCELQKELLPELEW